MEVTTALGNINDREMFEALFQYASVGILVVDSKSNILLANNFLLSQFGYNYTEEIKGKPIEILIPARFYHSHVGHRDKFIHGPQNRPMGLGMDLFGVKKSGDEFPVEISLSHYKNDSGTYVIAFINDITKRKEIENSVLNQKEELRKVNLRIEELNNELEQKVEVRTQQLQDTLVELQQSKDELMKALSKEKELGDLKSRFVSMASHEFRTPLSTILSSASLMAKYTSTDEQEKRDKHIHRIKSSVNNLTDILNEFLSIGKIEDGKILANYTTFNIKDCITSICTELQAIAKLNQQIKYTHQGNETVALDSSMLRNIIINLLSNAIKFSPEGAVINITTDVHEDTIVLVIEDKGLGISIEDQEHLFERFFRGKNVINIQGTGLGLHIVGKYVELLNGNIEFESELERGTKFIITFSTQLTV